MHLFTDSKENKSFTFLKLSYFHVQKLLVAGTSTNEKLNIFRREKTWCMNILTYLAGKNCTNHSECECILHKIFKHIWLSKYSLHILSPHPSKVCKLPLATVFFSFLPKYEYKISLFSCLCSIQMSFMLWSYQRLEVNLDLNQIKLLFGFWNFFYLLSEYTMDKLKERSTSFEPTGDILIQSPNWAFPVTYYIQI